MTKAKGKPPTRIHSVTYRRSAEPAQDGFQVLRSAKGRQIADIEIDLDKALRAETENMFVIGALLIEAGDKVAHGDWLPWLAKNFGRSQSTAYTTWVRQDCAPNFQGLEI